MTDSDSPDSGDEPGDDFRILDLQVGIGGGTLRDFLSELLDDARSSHSYREHMSDATPAARRSTDGSVDVGEVDDEDAYRVAVHRTNDALLVTADLLGVDADDLAVGVSPEPNELVIQVRGETVDRVSIPWEVVVATRTRFNNGVLEVVLRPATDSAEG